MSSSQDSGVELVCCLHGRRCRAAIKKIDVEEEYQHDMWKHSRNADREDARNERGQGRKGGRTREDVRLDMDQAVDVGLMHERTQDIMRSAEEIKSEKPDIMPLNPNNDEDGVDYTAKHYPIRKRTMAGSTYYYVETGEARPNYHLNLDHLVRYYQINAQRHPENQDYADLFPWWEMSF
ncbi:hypothetical protein KIN20_035494 [Parelaphostrongylus tenuis]|uniref:Uncharacterized protein n=1 Tax=Parelaphostrongylus tenuis TaxID=148309 RepID=A0AAD5RBD0_PARTN|nr:hypothetical protein KIN20_035494 [Parelaphostrongylus tenuis]